AGRTSLRYIGAAATVGVAFALTRLILPNLDPGSSPFFFAAVVVSAWAFGLGPGLLATLLAGTCSAIIYHGEGFLVEIGSDDFLRVIAFLAVSLLVTWLHESSRRAQERQMQAKHEAQRASAAKDRFLAILSHELRNPLVPIKMIADMHLDNPAIDES